MKIKGRGASKRKDVSTIAVIKLNEDDGLTIQQISKKLKCSYDTIVKIFSGERLISGDTTEEELKKYGYKICSCCEERLVPKHPLEHAKLSLLCPLCFRTEDQLEELRVIL